MKRIFSFTLVFLLIFHSNFLFAGDLGWKESFDRICAISGDSEGLTIVQLEELIVESDELLLRIEASEIPQKKVYLIRLKKCRNFFIFMRDFKRESLGP